MMLHDSVALQFLGLLCEAFWVWTIWDCVHSEPNVDVWLLILIVTNVVGSIAYFSLRWLPAHSTTPFRHWSNAEIFQAEAELKHIGNAYQYLRLADMRRDMGMWEEARVLYAGALSKEPQNKNAIWGMASVQLELKDYKGAIPHFEALLMKDENSKFGEVRLQYARALAAVGDREAAGIQYQETLKGRSSPEARFRLAELSVEENKPNEALDHLERLFEDVKIGTRAHARLNRKWIKDAKRLQAKLKKSSSR